MTSGAARVQQVYPKSKKCSAETERTPDDLAASSGKSLG